MPPLRVGESQACRSRIVAPCRQRPWRSGAVDRSATVRCFRQHARRKKRFHRCRSVFRLGRSAPLVTMQTPAQTAAATLDFLRQVSGSRSRTHPHSGRPYNNAARCRLGADARPLCATIRPPASGFRLWHELRSAGTAAAGCSGASGAPRMRPPGSAAVTGPPKTTAATTNNGTFVVTPGTGGRPAMEPHMGGAPVGSPLRSERYV